MNEQFHQSNPAVRTMADYMTLLAMLRHYADRAQRLQAGDDLLQQRAGRAGGGLDAPAVHLRPRRHPDRPLRGDSS